MKTLNVLGQILWWFFAARESNVGSSIAAAMKKEGNNFSYAQGGYGCSTGTYNTEAVGKSCGQQIWSLEPTEARNESSRNATANLPFKTNKTPAQHALILTAVALRVQAG